MKSLLLIAALWLLLGCGEDREISSSVGPVEVTAEFVDAASSNQKLRQLMKRSNVSQITLAQVDHTFSRDAWRNEVNASSLAMLKNLLSRPDLI